MYVAQCTTLSLTSLSLSLSLSLSPAVYKLRNYENDETLLSGYFYASEIRKAPEERLEHERDWEELEGDEAYEISLAEEAAEAEGEAGGGGDEPQ
jgi:hypothetical protein